MAKPSTSVQTLLGYLEKEDFPKALAYIKKHPQAFRAALRAMTKPLIPSWGNFAVSLSKDYSHIEEAIYRRILELDPKDAVTHNNLGNLLKDKGKLDEAKKHYRKAIELDPNLSQAHTNLGNLLGDKGKLDEAENEYRKAIELDPNLSQAHYNLGNLLKDKGELDEAENEFRKAIELDPKNADTHNNLGTLLADKGKLDEAENEFRKAIELNPSDPAPYYNYGILLEQQNQLKEALERYKQAEELINPEKNPFRLAHVKIKIALLEQRLALQARKEKPPKEVEVKNIILDVFDRMQAEGAVESFRQTIEKNQNKLDSVLAVPKERPVRKEKTLYVLRRFNSYTPILAYSGAESRGGGYFLEWNDYGIVIDPGFNFVQNFLEVKDKEGNPKFSITDIDAVVITHAHNDHTSDFEALLNLVYEYNDKNKTQKLIDVYLSPSAMKKLIGLFSLQRKIINHIYTLNSDDSQIEITKGLMLGAIPAKHHDIVSGEYCIGLVFTGEDKKIVFTSDTGWSSNLLQSAYEKHEGCDYLIAHIGTVTQQEMNYPNEQGNISDDKDLEERILDKHHLGLIGVIKAIETLKPKYVILSEFGEELKGLRCRICKILQSSLAEYTTRVIPGDIALQIRIDNAKVHCVTCNNPKTIDSMMYFEKEDKIEYICKDCLG